MIPPAAIMRELLGDTGVVAIVGDRIGYGELKQGTAYPALVYRVEREVPTPVVAHQKGPQRATCDVLVVPLAVQLLTVDEIHEAVRAACDFQQGVTIAGYHVVSLRLARIDAPERDDAIGLWTRPATYTLSYYR